MQTIHCTGLINALHPGKNERSATERIITNLSTSNLGIHKGAPSGFTAMDSFQITEHITDLLSPACANR